MQLAVHFFDCCSGPNKTCKQTKEAILMVFWKHFCEISEYFSALTASRQRSEKRQHRWMQRWRLAFVTSKINLLRCMKHYFIPQVPKSLTVTNKIQTTDKVQAVWSKKWPPKEREGFGPLNISIFTLPQIHSSCGRNVFSPNRKKKKRKRWVEEKVEWLRLAHMLVIYHT